MKKLLSLLLIAATIFPTTGFAKSADQIYRMPHSGSNIAGFGSIDLSKSAAVGSSILAAANGGAGGITSNAILMSNGTIATRTPGISYHGNAGELDFLGAGGSSGIVMGQASGGFGSAADFFIENRDAAGGIGFYTNSTFRGGWQAGGAFQVGSSGGETLDVASLNLRFVNAEGDFNFAGLHGIIYPNGTLLGFLSGNYGLPGSSDNTLAVGKHGTTSAYPIVVSAQPSTNGLMMVRGRVSNNGSCALSLGEGFTASHSATGQCAVSFFTAFQDVPVCTCTVDAQGTCANYAVDSASTFTPTTYNFANVAQDFPFYFVCIGQRLTAN